MAHHRRYPRLVSAALPEALRRAIYRRHEKRINAADKGNVWTMQNLGRCLWMRTPSYSPYTTTAGGDSRPRQRDRSTSGNSQRRTSRFSAAYSTPTTRLASQSYAPVRH